MPDIKDLIDDLDNTLRSMNLQNYNKLYAPLPYAQVGEMMSSVGWNMEEAKSLYQWKNGFDLDDRSVKFCSLFLHGTFFSLESIVRKKRIQDGDKDNNWTEDFIPFAGDISGAQLLFNNTPGDDYGRIHLYSASELYIDEPISIYDSIGSMLRTTVEAYKRGISSFEPGNVLIEVDFDKLTELGGDLNKKSDYWNE